MSSENQIEWGDWAWRRTFSSHGPGDPDRLKPDPPFIPAIDTRKPWEDPAVERIGSAEAYQALVTADEILASWAEGLQ